MEKPKSITQLSKEQLEDMCLNLMHVDKVKTEMINKLETICNRFMAYIDGHKLVLQNPNILDFYMEMKELERGKE